MLNGGQGGRNGEETTMEPQASDDAPCQIWTNLCMIKESPDKAYSLNTHCPIIATFDCRRQLLDQIAGTTMILAMQSHSETCVAVVTVEGI